MATDDSGQDKDERVTRGGVDMPELERNAGESGMLSSEWVMRCPTGLAQAKADGNKGR